MRCLRNWTMTADNDRSSERIFRISTVDDFIEGNKNFTMNYYNETFLISIFGRAKKKRASGK